MALTRAWCIFELAKTLAKRCKLYVVLNTADTKQLKNLHLSGFGKVQRLLSDIDVKDAQISKTEDREYIVGELAKLEGGIDDIRNYCETDVLNTYLIFLRFEFMRGKLGDKQLQREYDLVRSSLASLDQPHLNEFLSNWPA